MAGRSISDPRAIWRLFARHWHLFRGTPTRMWFDHALHDVFGVRERLSLDSADRIYDQLADALGRPEFRPRALRTLQPGGARSDESPLDPLDSHKKLRSSGWRGRVITTFRPDPVVDPEWPGFPERVSELGALTRENTSTWSGYLHALANRRAYFASFGATATDHGHPSAATFDLPREECATLLERAPGDRSPLWKPSGSAVRS